MIISKTALDTASPKTKRAVRYEFELEHEALDCIFAAKHTREFKLLLACVQRWSVQTHAAVQT